MKNRFYNSLCLFALIVLGLSGLQPLNAQGVDSLFTPPQVFRPALVKQMVPAANGKVYVAGEISRFGDTKVARVVRLTPSGFLDTSFKAQLPEKEVSFIEVLPNGNVIVVTEEGLVDTNFEIYVLASNGNLLKFLDPPVGYITSVKGLADNRFLVGGSNSIVRYTKNFNLDNTFKSLNNLGAPIDDIQFQGDKLIIVGAFESLGYNNEYYEINNVARLNMDGSMDTTFQGLPEPVGEVQRVLVTPDHNIYITGDYLNASRRLNSDGTVDTTFHFPVEPRYMAYNNGKITIEGTQQIVRIDTSGVVDSTFTSIDVPANSQMSVLPDQSLLVANYLNVRFGIAKFSSTGALTDTHKSQLLRKGEITDVRAQGQGAPIVISGDFVRVNSVLTYNVARLKHDGSVDAGFSVAENYGPVHDIAYVGGGNVMVAASQKLFRATSTGQVDPTFNNTPASGAPITKVILQGDGKLIIGGRTVSGIYRIHTNGAYDSTFNIGVGPCCFDPNYVGYDFDLDKNTGKIVFTGQFDAFNGYPTRGLVRLNPNGSVDTTYNIGSGTNVSGYIEKIKMFSNGSVLLSGSYYQFNGSNINREFLRVNTDGSLNTTFNSNILSLPFYSPSVVEFFHDRVLVAENDFYLGFLQAAITTNGAKDPDFQFPTGVEILYLNGYYSNNSTELYAFGTVDVTGQGIQSIVRLRYNNPAARLATTAKTGNTVARNNVETKVSFYPNPAKDFVNIDAGDAANVAIYDWTGRTSFSKSIGSSEEQIDISSLPRGRYVLVITKGKTTERQHFVKD